MRFGVIGAGRWGRNIIRTLRGMSGVRLACVASRNAATIDLVGSACVVEQDWRRLLHRGHVDAVAVAVPPAAHAEIVTEAVTVGLPVFVEKPLTCDAAEAERLFDLAARRNGYVMIDHVHLFSHAYRGLKARLSSIGPIRRIQTDAGAWGPFRADTPVLWDWGPHDAAFCLDLLGTCPVSSSAQSVEKRPIDGAWGETLVLQAVYPGSVTASIRVSNLARQRRRTLRVDGEIGMLIYDAGAATTLTFQCAHPAGVEPEVIAIPAEPPLECALAQFASNVSTGRMSLDDLRFGVDVVRMLDAWDTGLRGRSPS